VKRDASNMKLLGKEADDDKKEKTKGIGD